MRITARGTLRDFWERYPDTEQELKYWHEKIKNADYRTASEVIEIIRGLIRWATTGLCSIFAEIVTALLRCSDTKCSGSIFVLSAHTKIIIGLLISGIYEGYEDVRANQK